MLESLEVRGLGIIDRVSLRLSPGFVVLSGETGAGKSLLVESLKLLSGQRAQSDLVRTGDDRLLVEGVFTMPELAPVAELLEELGVALEDALIVRRELSSGGRGRCWINDQPVTATALQRLAPHLMAIHGQHESHGLTGAEAQRALVDDFAAHEDLLQATAESYEAWSAAHREVITLEEAQSSRRDRLDAISFQLAEIDGVDPQPGEDEDLRRRRQLLRHAVRLMELRTSLLAALSEDDDPVLDRLGRAERRLEEMLSCGLELSEERARLSEARILVEEVVRSLQTLPDTAEEDPDQLEGVESRLHRLEQLMLKYGSSLDEVLAHREALVAERCTLGSLDEQLAASRAAAGQRLAAYREHALELEQSRRRAGERLAAEVSTILEKLAMPGTRLEFRWQAVDDPTSPLEWHGRRVAFSALGVLECELYFAANPGEELRPMARVASGGELSRLHLALRTALRRRLGGAPKSLLFDEVDSGLGGATAAALAELLAALAQHDQVLVVTHLPQVAARATAQFRILKVESSGRAVTRVEALDTAGRERELARMLAGEQITDAALSHARELLGGP